MKIYVATKTHNFQRARKLMQALRNAGHHVTYDWTEDVEAVGPDHENEKAKDEGFLRHCAQNDMYGVKAAHRVVALGHPRVCGTLVEIGMALGAGKPVDLIGEFPPSVFWSLDIVTQYKDEDEYLAFVNRPWSIED